MREAKVRAASRIDVWCDQVLIKDGGGDRDRDGDDASAAHELKYHTGHPSDRLSWEGGAAGPAGAPPVTPASFRDM